MVGGGGDRVRLENEMGSCYHVCVPRGSLLDDTRPQSPTGVDAFPAPMNDGGGPDEPSKGDDLTEVLDGLVRDRVVHLRSTVRTIGLDEDTGYRICQMRRRGNGSLADTGANISVAPSRYRLVNVRRVEPVPISVALEKEGQRIAYCDEMGDLPILQEDGTFHYQPFFVHKDASDMIISPASILLAGKGRFNRFTQTGFYDDTHGSLEFYSKEGQLVLCLPLEHVNGLYYWRMEAFDLDNEPVKFCGDTRVSYIQTEEYDVGEEVHRLPPLSEEGTYAFDGPFLDPLDGMPFDAEDSNGPCHAGKLTAPHKKRLGVSRPVHPTRQLEAELWAARMGHCSETQLDVLPGGVTGTPDHFECHPFRFVDHKTAARMCKKAKGGKVARVDGCGKRFYMDFGFMRASTTDFNRPDETTDRVVESYDKFTSYLLIVDEHSRYTWVLLMKSKEPPIEDVTAFLETFGLESGGLIRCDQGGELANSHEFMREMMRRHRYVVEPTGADSPSQNGGAERMNDTLAVSVRALLYGAALKPKFWSAVLLHAVWLHNRKVHSITRRTPFEGWYGMRPDLSQLKMFGSRVCVKRPGKRRAKLDRHDYQGIFLGYSARDQNIHYLDLNSGLVKTSHHAYFDEAWYLQPSRPPAAQLLYSLGQLDDSMASSPIPPRPVDRARYPPALVDKDLADTKQARNAPLPLGLLLSPARTATAARVGSGDPYEGTVLGTYDDDFRAVEDYKITRQDVTQVYMSPHAYHGAFEEELRLGRYGTDHATAGLVLEDLNGRLIVTDMAKSTPAHRIPRWRTRVRGAWLQRVGDKEILTLDNAVRAFADIKTAGTKSCLLTLSHPEIQHGLTNEGIPQVNVDQLNPRYMFKYLGLTPRTDVERLTERPKEDYPMPDPVRVKRVETKWDGDVFNYVGIAMKLTRGKLLKADDWDNWRLSEWTQLDQYDGQGMFGDPVKVDSDEAVFNLVWTYVIKKLDKRKKARCTCDGSTRSGQVWVLDYTYANCVDQTSGRLFYAAAAAENLLIYGADISNAFGEAGAPKQGFYIRPDKAFHEWWTVHKGREPIPPGHVIPVLEAMQGHPEAPRLWEKHADAILRALGLTLTRHEPCLYSGLTKGERVLFKRQVEDFEVAVREEQIANILFDMIDEKLTFPLKRMGLVDMFNGLDILQTRDYIKVSCKTYIERVCQKHLAAWMTDTGTMGPRPTPLPCRDSFVKAYMKAVGDPDPKQ